MSFFQKRRLPYIPSMRVAIIRTPDVNFDEYQKLIRLLNSQSGQIIFEEFDEIPPLLEAHWEKWKIRKKVRWSEALNTMQHIKQDLEYTRDEAVVLLTDLPNERNYFSFANNPDQAGPGNHCIDVGGWYNLLDHDFVFPTLHLIASNLIQGWMYQDMDAWYAVSHQEAQGCISDFCADKRDILKRLRTADICPHCEPRFSRAVGSNQLQSHHFHQCMELVELARTELLFHKRIETAPITSSIVVQQPRMRLWLADLNREIRMQTIPHCLYVLYLRYPAGIAYDDLEFHIEELIEIHGRIKGNKTRDELHALFTALVDPVDRSRLNQSISRMRGSLREAVGNSNLSSYMWSSESGPIKRVSIAGTLNMVRFE